MSKRGGWEGENRESKQSKREEMSKKKEEERKTFMKRGKRRNETRLKSLTVPFVSTEGK